jgi:hypothetical protein
VALNDSEADIAFNGLRTLMSRTKYRYIDGAWYPGSSMGVVRDPTLVSLYRDFAQQNFVGENVAFLIDTARDCFQSSLAFDIWEHPSFTFPEWRKKYYYNKYFKSGEPMQINVSMELLEEAKALMGPSGSRSGPATLRRLGNLFHLSTYEVVEMMDKHTDSWLRKFYGSSQFKQHGARQATQNNPRKIIRFGKNVQLHSWRR